MTVLMGDLARPHLLDEDPALGTIEFVAKISVRVPEGVVRDIKKVARGDVGGFVAEAIRNELDRRRLHALAEELVEELGPPDEADIAEINTMLAEIDAANAKARRGGDE